MILDEIISLASLLWLSASMFLLGRLTGMRGIDRDSRPPNPPHTGWRKK